MSLHSTLRLSLAATLAFTTPAQAQFVEDSSGNPTGPGIASSTENVDFADVDLDGDWDAAFADGAVESSGSFDQNRLWVNQGGLQLGVQGTFTDETDTRMPTANDSSGDVEFADYDGDGDADLFVANSSQIVNQSSKFLVNQGASQGGMLGFYADETADRWVGLGQAGSSIQPFVVLQSGGFIDWSGDADFGDLDNDGDLDLVHTTYGGAFAGQVPTRIFLNDGAGFFTEFNPGGGVLASINIEDGDPAIWAEGLQDSATTDVTGQFADVATVALDGDLGDLDGDFDLDLVLGDRTNDPRVFANRLEENGGVLGFRDVTAAAMPPDHASGFGHYEQELGDLDGDGDLDLYGVNWAEPFFDRTLTNAGNGQFSFFQDPVPETGFDDNEADFLDYDNDGDLDVFVAHFSGPDRIFGNDGTGLLAAVQEAGSGGITWDADAADIDGDGDTDLILAEDNFQPNKTLVNVTQIPDVHPPSVPKVEHPGPQAAGAAPVPVRAHVYDNAPYYITWYNPTRVDVTVDGCDLGSIEAMSSQGQVFRAELPGNLVGAVDFHWVSQDEYGNTGTSAVVSYTSTTALAYATPFGPSTASVSTGQPPALEALSVPFPGTTLYLSARGGAGVGYLLALYTEPVPGGLVLPGLLVANVVGTKILLTTGVLGPSGCDVTALPLAEGLPTGASAHGQVFTLDGSVGGDLLASSQGWTITTQAP